MKVLSLNGEFYLYPNGVTNIDEFAELLEKENRKLIKLRKLFEKNCVSPYYIFEQIRECYVSIASIDDFFEEEVVILENDEYEKLLNNVKKKLCSKCDERSKCLSDEKQGFREKLCLDCSCFEYFEEVEE